jgi:predicted lipid-binding transport protein (Tim44 family)
MMVSIVLGILVIGLLIVGQKMAQKMAAQNKAAMPQALAAASLPAEPQADSVPVAQHYKSDKVGNDAAARPWDHGAATAAGNTPATPSSSGWEQTKVSTLSFRPDQLPDRVPAHFDLALLLDRSKEAFMRLHTAWEEGDAVALHDLLVPTIWQQVEGAMQAQALPDWGQRLGEVQHLAARVLEAQACDDGRVRARLEFTGSQLHAADAQTRPIHEVWDVRYHEQPLLWQIADLQAGHVTQLA